MSPVETKVKASTATAAASGIVLWILGRYVFKGSPVPDVVTSWVYVVVPAVLTFAAGYLAKHTPRPAPVAQVSQVQGAYQYPGPQGPHWTQPGPLPQQNFGGGAQAYPLSAQPPGLGGSVSQMPSPPTPQAPELPSAEEPPAQP